MITAYYTEPKYVRGRLEPSVLNLVHPCSLFLSSLALFRPELAPGEKQVMQSSNTGSASFAASDAPQCPDPPARALNAFVVSLHHHTMLVESALPMLFQIL